MSVWLIVPIKQIGAAKSRLRPALNDQERRALVRQMLKHVVETARSARNVSHVVLLSPPQPDLPAIALIEDRGPDLNGALSAAMASIAPEVSRIVVVAADLPAVTQQDVEALAGVAASSVAIAPDRAGRGTNALSLPLPQARDFRFAFGLDSFARHCGEAVRLELPLEVIRSDTLALDVDEPEHLADAGWTA